MHVTLSELANWCGGQLIPPEAGEQIAHGVSTDSRTIRKGEVFVAIDGLNQDGHRYIRFAASSGAVAAVIEKRSHDSGRLPVIVVDDSLEALGRMANSCRWHPPLIPWLAVTGANGKTTTRQLLSLILSSRWNVRISHRNWNNFIGLALSMMGPPDDAGAAVMEMGASKPGDIAKLREVCVPTVGIITSIGKSSHDGFDDAGVAAREAADIFGWIPPDGLAIYPADDPNAETFRNAVIHRGASFSIDPQVQADLVARDVVVTADGSQFSVEGGARILLPLLGRHNIGNCLAAMLAARHFGIDYHEAGRAIMKAKPVPGRLEAIKTPARLTIINDSYNANPDSALAALEVLNDFPEGRKIVVFGDMANLGTDGRRWHRELGVSVGMMDVDALFVTGPETAAMAEAAQVNARIVVRHFPSVDALWMTLRTYLKPGDQVLVKGSRGMLMERVVNHLQEWFR